MSERIDFDHLRRCHEPGRFLSLARYHIAKAKRQKMEGGLFGSEIGQVFDRINHLEEEYRSFVLCGKTHGLKQAVVLAGIGARIHDEGFALLERITNENNSLIEGDLEPDKLKIMQNQAALNRLRIIMKHNEQRNRRVKKLLNS